MVSSDEYLHSGRQEYFAAEEKKDSGRKSSSHLLPAPLLYSYHCCQRTGKLHPKFDRARSHIAHLNRIGDPTEKLRDKTSYGKDENLQRRRGTSGSIQIWKQQIAKNAGSFDLSFESCMARQLAIHLFNMHAGRRLFNIHSLMDARGKRKKRGERRDVAEGDWLLSPCQIPVHAFYRKDILVSTRSKARDLRTTSSIHV